MPKRVYVGSHQAVELLLPTGETVTVARGAAVDLPDDIAKECDASSAWSTTSSTSTAKAADDKKE